MTGAESRTFLSKETAIEYCEGNMLRYRISGPHEDREVNYFIAGGTTKHHTERKYYETSPMFNGVLRRIKNV